MNKAMAMIGSLGAGAGLMYMFDPKRGKRRRAEVRNKVTHAWSKTNDVIDKTARDVTNRASGLAAEAGALFIGDKVSNDVLTARVRAKLGRLVEHPHAIEVRAADGKVTLSGPVLAAEVDRLLKGVAAVKGVTEVEDRLEAHDEADNVPELSGGRQRLSKRPMLMKSNWSPTTRLLVGTAGGVLALYATKRRGLIGAALGPAGFGLVSRALTNLDLRHLVGVGVGAGAVTIQKTITIAAPVAAVFDFWMQHENYPQFMSNVREVVKTGEATYHWLVAGPAGVSVEWDAEITKQVPNQLITFKSLPGSAIEQTGSIHFTPVTEGETCVNIKMSYTPPAGAIGHLVAMLFGADPKKEMDEDLMRMKSFIETGRVPHDAASGRAKEAAAR